MSDAEIMFNSEVATKKRVARGSHNKKTHNGKGGCRLPSDSLSKKEKEALNGPVTSVKLVPMSWKDFKKLPDSGRKYYIEALRAKYGARDTWLGEMMGVKDSTINYERKRLGIPGFPRGAHSDMNKDNWEAFVFGVDAKPVEAKAPVEVPAVIPTVTWEDLFAAAKILGERYGVNVRVEVSAS